MFYLFQYTLFFSWLSGTTCHLVLACCRGDRQQHVALVITAFTFASSVQVFSFFAQLMYSVDCNMQFVYWRESKRRDVYKHSQPLYDDREWVKDSSPAFNVTMTTPRFSLTMRSLLFSLRLFIVWCPLQFILVHQSETESFACAIYWRIKVKLNLKLVNPNSTYRHSLLSGISVIDWYTLLVRKWQRLYFIERPILLHGSVYSS